MQSGCYRGWLVLVTALFVSYSSLGSPAAALAGERFVPPVDGRIIKRFEEPLGPYAAGHRGLDFGIPPGTPVVAAGSGTVKFAGPVARDGLFITIIHSGGLETTYSYLSKVDVAAGDRVTAGDTIGKSGDGHPGWNTPALHFGAKQSGKYVDPELLLFRDLDDISDLIALAPLEEQGGSSAAKQDVDSRFGPLNGMGGQGSAGTVGRAGQPPVGGTSQRDAARNQAGGSSAAELLSSPGNDRAAVDRGSADAGDSRGGPVQRQDKPPATKKASKKGKRSLAARAADGLSDAFNALPATRLAKVGWDEIKCLIKGGAPLPDLPTTKELRAGAKAPAAPNDNIVVAVGGIGSSSAPGKDGKIEGDSSLYQMDWRSLGYGSNQVYFYSYKGVEENLGQGSYTVHAPYAPEDTYQPIADSASILARHIQEIHARNPGRKIDIVGHSQGGVVAQYYVTYLYDPTDPAAAPLDHMVTISSPHRGADLAAAHAILDDTAGGREARKVLEDVVEKFGMPPLSASSVRELAEGSKFMRGLIRDWDPTKIDTTTIGATFDYVVTPQHTRLAGADHYISDLPPGFSSLKASHGEVVGANRTKQLIYNALADAPSRCTPARNWFAEYGPGYALSLMEDGFLHALDLAFDAPAPGFK